jgi:ornithine carbamoyltransferase
MPSKIRHFLTLADVSAPELMALLAKTAECKRSRRRHHAALAGQTVALVFQKPSMRTRVAFEVAVLQLGGSVVYLGQDDIRLGEREPIKDVARVLSRYVDAIVARTFAHSDAEAFARYASCPVINGLSDGAHPCQALADLFTLQEHFGRLQGLKVAYIGDGNNVLHSLAEGCAMLGVTLSVATPADYKPQPGTLGDWHEDPRQAVKGAQVIYTDVWVSMGQEQEREQRLKVFQPYQVNEALLKGAAAGARVMHCLPAHRAEEITDEVMESPRSLIVDQAENRLHAQKALLLFLMTRTKTRSR